MNFPFCCDSDQHQQIRSQDAISALRKQFADLIKLIKIPENRLMVAGLLYGEEVISFELYENAVETCGKSDLEKASSLMRAVNNVIQTQPQLLLKLIDVLSKEEPFKQIAKKLCDSLSTRV